MNYSKHDIKILHLSKKSKYVVFLYNGKLIRQYYDKDVTSEAYNIIEGTGYKMNELIADFHKNKTERRLQYFKISNSVIKIDMDELWNMIRIKMITM